MNQDLATATTNVQDLLREQLLVDVGSPEEDLLSSGLLDSLTLVQLLVSIEERFGVRIALSDLQLDDIRSISSIANLIANRRGQVTGASARL
jgi:D-alanine--poly(phosphoribitol) ligase subunit 2